MGMSALEEAQISLNEAALAWLRAQETGSEDWQFQYPFHILLKAAVRAFRDLAEARGPGPESEFPPRSDTSQQGKAQVRTELISTLQEMIRQQEQTQESGTPS